MKNKPLIIIGTGTFAELLKYYLEHDGKRIVSAFSVDRQYIKQNFFCNLPVIPFEDIQRLYLPEEYDVIMGIGTSNMNNLRGKMFLKCKEKGYHVASFFHSSCVISEDVQMGEGNIILEKSLIQPFVRIGNGNLLWDNISITHNDKIGDFNTLSGFVGLCGFTEVKNHCYLGKSCMVHDKVIIADYTLVGAGAYVKNNTRPYDVIVPARSVTLEGKKSTDFM